MRYINIKLNIDSTIIGRDKFQFSMSTLDTSDCEIKLKLTFRKSIESPLPHSPQIRLKLLTNLSHQLKSELLKNLSTFLCFLLSYLLGSLRWADDTSQELLKFHLYHKKQNSHGIHAVPKEYTDELTLHVAHTALNFTPLKMVWTFLN
jgi:hypothetical protein